MATAQASFYQGQLISQQLANFYTDGNGVIYASSTTTPTLVGSTQIYITGSTFSKVGQIANSLGIQSNSTTTVVLTATLSFDIRSTPVSNLIWEWIDLNTYLALGPSSPITQPAIATIDTNTTIVNAILQITDVNGDPYKFQIQDQILGGTMTAQEVSGFTVA